MLADNVVQAMLELLWKSAQYLFFDAMPFHVSLCCMVSLVEKYTHQVLKIKVATLHISLDRRSIAHMAQ